jgi:hypothetical protein
MVLFAIFSLAGELQIGCITPGTSKTQQAMLRDSAGVRQQLLSYGTMEAVSRTKRLPRTKERFRWLWFSPA